MIFIYTTFATKKEAQTISRALVKNKLAACVGYWPIESIYEWKGKMRNEKEYACLVKTAKRSFDKAADFIKKRHPYELPCIVALPITTSTKEYRQWVMSCVK